MFDLLTMSVLFVNGFQTTVSQARVDSRRIRPIVIACNTRPIQQSKRLLHRLVYSRWSWNAEF